MYTKTRRPGKFEGNRSQMLAEAVYDAIGSGGASAECDANAEGCGWSAALVEGKRHDYIGIEDSMGFFDVAIYAKGQAADDWASLKAESEAYYSEADEARRD